MTNVSSGSKRSYEGGHEPSSHKRPREDARDWRDVHLRSPRRLSPHGRRDGSDYRDERRRSDYRGPSRDHDHRPLDYGRDRDRRDERGRDSGRDKIRREERDRSRPHSRDYHRERDGSRRGTTSSPTNRKTSEPARQVPVLREDSEKEEGEISPRPDLRQESISSVPTRAATPPPPTPPEQEQELELATSPPPVEDILAARRARRQAILAKHAGKDSSDATPISGPSSAVEPPPAISSISDYVSQSHRAAGTPPVSAIEPKGEIGVSSKRESLSATPAPAAFALAKDGEEENVQAKVQAQDGASEQILAADYDPSLDRREDEEKRVRGVVEQPQADVEVIEEEEEEEEEEEDYVDDMFAVAIIEKKKVKKVKRVMKPAPALITTTLDSAADSEGYYQIILGELLDGGRYQVFSSLGKGMFANVVRARVLQSDIGEVGKEVAIKIVRCQESMHRAGQKEAQILNKLRLADPDDKKHIVRLERTFEHRGHLCLVFESMSMNLRDVIKRFGKDVGLNIRAVRAYAHQLFLAMSLLRKCNIMHADIKPDNILVNEQKNVLKLCDLGSASDASENEITPYLVSRFYRAPEIILGVPYDPALDIWSIGCTLYELYTGKILFPGRSNNHMLLLMMELKGRFNTKMIKKAKFGDLYFDELGNFQSIEIDKVTGTEVIRKVHITKPTRDLRSRLMPSSSKLKDDEAKTLTAFIDLLDKCLALDPSKRITPKEALAHPFIRG
ncbi:unnamed protein product [Somion occarium]|uniref:non-specific serine/threonine protein kinase n=1 Tax=Somion occarium TaxID=3059160 RepID=A0ABP1D7Z2_9APHY